MANLTNSYYRGGRCAIVGAIVGGLYGIGAGFAAGAATVALPAIIGGVLAGAAVGLLAAMAENFIRPDVKSIEEKLDQLTPSMAGRGR